MDVFKELAVVAAMAYDTPSETYKDWNTKVACEHQVGIAAPYLEGFVQGVTKEASSTETYIYGSELGKEIGLNMLYNIKHSPTC